MHSFVSVASMAAASTAAARRVLCYCSKQAPLQLLVTEMGFFATLDMFKVRVHCNGIHV
jgi:hypothetical protein